LTYTEIHYNINNVGNKIEILLIGDGSQIQDLLKDTLQSIGYEVRMAEDLYVANEILSNYPIDLILIDSGMVDSSNFRFIRAVRARLKHIPIILMADPVHKFDLERAKDAGVDDFLQRPFRIERVERVIEDTLTLYDFRQIGENAFLNKRVLVVDDDKHLRLMLIDALRNYGYKPSGAGNGEKAMRILEREGFDMVISDIRMPKMDGISLMREIKDKCPFTPVVIITGYGQAYTLKKAFDAGADGFLSKPFRLKELERIIREFINGGR